MKDTEMKKEDMKTEKEDHHHSDTNIFMLGQIHALCHHVSKAFSIKTFDFSTLFNKLMFLSLFLFSIF